MVTAPQPDPAAVLHQELWDAVQTVYRRHDSQAPLNHVNVVKWVEAVERIVAARTADAAARLAAVEALPQVILNTVDPLLPGHEVRVQVVDLIRAALSATAPDAGQREAQERAEVLREAADLVYREAGVQWGRDDYRGWLRALAVETARADRSPEQP